MRKQFLWLIFSQHSGKWMPLEKLIYNTYHKPPLSLTPWYISAAFPFQELISQGEMWQPDITWPWISPQGWGTVPSPPSLALPCWQDSTSPARDSPIPTPHCCTFWARSRLQVMCNRYTVYILQRCCTLFLLCSGCIISQLRTSEMLYTFLMCFKGEWVSWACKHLRWTSGLTSQYSLTCSLKYLN